MYADRLYLTRLLPSIHVLDAVALVFEGSAVGTDSSHPATILALVFVGRYIAADTIPARRSRYKPGFIDDVRAYARTRTARITSSRRSTRAVPPIAGAIDIKRRKRRAQSWIDNDSELRRGQIEVVSGDCSCRERRTFLDFEPNAKCTQGGSCQIANAVPCNYNTGRFSL